MIGKTSADNDKEDIDNDAEDEDDDNAEESEGDDFEQETGWFCTEVPIILHDGVDFCTVLKNTCYKPSFCIYPWLPNVV